MVGRTLATQILDLLFLTVIPMISQRDAEISRGAERIRRLLEPQILQANGLSQNCHGPELETYYLLVIPRTHIAHYTQWTPRPIQHSFGLTCLPTQPTELYICIHQTRAALTKLDLR